MVGISGRRSKQRIYDSARQGGGEFSCPKTRAVAGTQPIFQILLLFAGVLVVPSSVSLLRIVLMYVFGNSEYAGFAFKLNFTGRVCRQLDLSGFCAMPGHHISDWCALIKPRKHESSISGIFPNPQLLHGVSQDLTAGVAIPVLECALTSRKRPSLRVVIEKARGQDSNTFFRLSSDRAKAVSVRLSSAIRDSSVSP
jgi:hypothetical protein